MIIKYLKRLFSTSRQNKKYKGGRAIRQGSIKEFKKVKQELEEAGGICNANANTKKSAAEEEKNKDYDALKERHRYEIIESLHEGIDVFKDDEFRKASIESFAKSKMSIEDIKTHLDQVRLVNNSSRRIGGSVQTKLPQKTIPDKRNNDFSYIE